MAKRDASGGKAMKNSASVIGGKSGKNTQVHVDLQRAMSAWQCVCCDTAVVDDEHDSIECFACKNWAHKKCAGLSDDVFHTLSDPKQANIHWVCQHCLEGNKGILSRHDNRLDKLLDLIPMMQSLNSRIESIEKGLLGEKLEEKIEEVVDRKIAEMMEEQREIEKRKLNLIIVNLKESAKAEVEERKKDDLIVAKSLLSKLVPLDDNEVCDPVRLGAIGGNKPRMLRVTVKSEEKKKEIMKKAPELNKGITDSVKKVYVNNDFTQKQRQAYKELRAEKLRRTEAGEKNLMIRNGKIVIWKNKTDESSKGDSGNLAGGGSETSSGNFKH